MSQAASSADGAGEDVADRVFVRPRTADVPSLLFTASLPHRALGYHFPQHCLDRTQWSAFIRALRTSGVGDDEAFVISWSPPTPSFWRIRLSDHWPYEDLSRDGWSGVWESAVYSVRGDWALAMSDEEFALAAGPEQFIVALGEAMPEFDDQAVRQFVRYWRTAEERLSTDTVLPPQRMPGRWVPQLLHHVFGEQAQPWLDLFHGELT